MIGRFTIALLTAEFGQVWAEYLCHNLTPQLWHDVTPHVMLSVKRTEMDGGTDVMITYDATKMDGAYSDGISSITPLSH